MKRKASATLSWIAGAIMLVSGCVGHNQPSGGDYGSPPLQSIGYTEEWETIPAAESGLPMITRDDVTIKVKNQIEAFKELTPWEARYRSTFTQTSPAWQESISVSMVSDNRRWYWGVKTDTSRWSTASDGIITRVLWPDANQVQLLSIDKNVSLSSSPTLQDFLPQLPVAEALGHTGGTDLPNILEFLKDPQTRLMPLCTRVNGQVCYILERKWKQQQPIFRDETQADRWLKEHSKDKIYSYSFFRPTIYINPNAKAEQKVTSTMIIRLALDPNLGFAVVRCAIGHETQMPKTRFSFFPSREIEYSDFHKIDDGLYLPRKMEFTIYNASGTDGSKKEIFQQSQTIVEDFVKHQEVKMELFTPSIPDGYKVMDTIRKIDYTVGDSKEKIEALAAAAKARDDFYSRLGQQPAPFLEASQWINSNPIDLVSQTGRPVILHFWGIGCPACMSELGHLQREFGDTIKSSKGPLFVSIHPYVDDNNLNKLKKILKEKDITFPVMIDSPYDKFWGKTFYKYRIFSLPSEIKIAPNGHLSELPDTPVSENDRWFENSVKNKITDENQGQKK